MEFSSQAFYLMKESTMKRLLMPGQTDQMGRSLNACAINHCCFHPWQRELLLLAVAHGEQRNTAMGQNNHH